MGSDPHLFLFDDRFQVFRWIHPQAGDRGLLRQAFAGVLARHLGDNVPHDHAGGGIPLHNAGAVRGGDVSIDQ